MKEMTAKECAETQESTTVKLHVIYDSNLNDKQKEKFRQQILQNAKVEYGTDSIHFDVTEVTGSISLKDGKLVVEGLVSGAINVGVTDKTEITGVQGRSGSSNSTALSVVNADHGKANTLTHELAHQFLGDTRGLGVQLMNEAIGSKDYAGAMILGLGLNSAYDANIDLQMVQRIGSPEWTKVVSKYGRVPSDFNSGAKALQSLIQPKH